MKDYFFLAFNNLRRRKLRSWLTMIGIFIGIAAVVALTSLGQGLQNTIEEQFEKLGSDKIIISPKGMGPPGTTSSESMMLTTKELEAIQEVRGVKWVIGMLVKQGYVNFKGESNIGYVMGMDPNDLKLMGEIQAFKVEEGRDLKEGDKFKVVVGQNHFNGKIWDSKLKLGSTIIIENHEFKVVGILGVIGNPVDDASMYVPKETLKEILKIEDEESQIMAKVEEGFDPIKVAETIERKLRKIRGEKEGQETFNVQTSEQLLGSFQNIFGVVQAVLIGIAAISLLVGGIGIMNTMYTSVLERTKEIGTMKAIGAKNSNILMIFLFESGLLGFIGGVIGVGIGIGLSKGAEYLATLALGTDLLKADTGFILIGGALAFSFFIGAVSGVLPAMQAAKLKPAKALRYE